MRPINVLIADDEQIIRRGLRAMLEKDSAISVIGEAEDGELALRLCTELHPDLALVDINMPFLDGLSFIEQLMAITPSTVVIVISGHDDFEYAQKAIELGVFAYLLKPVKETKLLDTVGEAKRLLARNQEQDAYLLWAEEQISKNRETLVSSFLQSLLSGSYEPVEIQQEERYLGVTVPDPFSLLLMKMTQKSTVMEKLAWQDSLVFFATREHALALFPASTLCCRVGNSELVLLCEQLETDEYPRLMKRVEERLEHQISAQLTWVYAEGEGYTAIGEAFAHLETELAQLEQLPKTLLQAQSYLNEHYWENTISLTLVAEVVQVTPQHLSRLFKTALNLTFVEYLTILRIQKAIALFKDPEIKIYEVAEAVGYSSQHYFCTAFKRVLHLSPQEYRKTQMRGTP